MESMLAKVARKFLLLAVQAAIILISFCLAIGIRYDGAIPVDIVTFSTLMIVPLLIVKLSSFATMRLLSSWWRYVSIHDLILLIKANILASSVFVIYLSWAHKSLPLPATVFILDGMICFLLMSGTRMAVRIARECLYDACKTCNQTDKKVLIVGTGAASQSIVREIRQNPKLDWSVCGFVDQDLNRQKQRFQGIPVLGSISDIERLLREQAVAQVILANPALGIKELRKIVALCQKAGVKSKILPNVGEMLNGQVSIQHVRDVRLEDLLGRPPVHLDVRDIEQYITDKRIMVTGAAGSIGREICRQVAKFNAASIVLFDNAETPLFHVEMDLKKQFPEVNFIVSLSDVRDFSSVNSAFDNYRPEVVFHAAAYKHVPMSEKNPLAVLENNVLGTHILTDAAHHYMADHFVMVSTDKAVNPTNTMGASKRAAEIYAQSLARHSNTSFVTVRFGNVLGSNGSVVPIFQDQIRNGGPVTVTDKDATRFFMTIPEAVQLVLQAGSMGQGGEIFILDMGEQICIKHLAEELIRLSGMVPYKDIDITYTGLRPGEKLHEELLLDAEGVMPTKHEKICVANATEHDLGKLQQHFEQLRLACKSMDRDHALGIIKLIVPEFQYTASVQSSFIEIPSTHKDKTMPTPLDMSEVAFTNH